MWFVSVHSIPDQVSLHGSVSSVQSSRMPRGSLRPLLNFNNASFSFAAVVSSSLPRREAFRSLRRHTAGHPPSGGTNFTFGSPHSWKARAQRLGVRLEPHVDQVSTKRGTTSRLSSPSAMRFSRGRLTRVLAALKVFSGRR